MSVKIGRQDLLDELHRFAKEFEERPTYNGMAEKGRYSATPYETEFGTWNTALKAAGFALNHRNYIPDEELLAELRRLDDELGRTPTSDDMRESGQHDPVAYQRAFGYWNTALRKAGFDPNYRVNITDDELIAAVTDLADELERAPLKNEMNARGQFTEITFSRAFGSWSNALIAAGFKPYSERRGPPLPNEYGSTWQAKRKLCLERDGYRCVGCPMTDETHRSIYNRRLEAHHVIPKERFRDENGVLDEEKAHALSNLRTFCKPCHRKWEGIPVAPQRPAIA